MTTLLYFWNRISKYVTLVATHYQFQTKMRTPHHSQVQEKEQNEISLPHKMGIMSFGNH